jgi:hypothetical protein
MNSLLEIWLDVPPELPPAIASLTMVTVDAAGLNQRTRKQTSNADTNVVQKVDLLKLVMNLVRKQASFLYYREVDVLGDFLGGLI